MSRKANLEEIEGIPSWSIPWFEYGYEADVNYSTEDMAMINAWQKDNPNPRYMSCGESEGFNRHPAFGPACDTYTCTFERLPEKPSKNAFFGNLVNTYHICFTNTDPDGMSSPINVRVAVHSNLNKKGVWNIIRRVLSEEDMGDYDSTDEFVEAVMKLTSLKWSWDHVKTDLFFEI